MNWKIPISEQFVKDEWVDDLSKFLKTTQLSEYVHRELFEKRLADYCGCKYAIAVNSGTSAIMLAMIALGLSTNYVIGPAYGNIAWVNCCRFLGIKPYSIDVRRDNFCLDDTELSKVLSKKRSFMEAVLYINHAGYTGPQLDEVVEICKYYNIPLLEDSCNALGQWYNGIHAGLRGDVGFLSFSTPKLISCCEGGALLLNNEGLYNKCKTLAYHGGWYDHPPHTKLEMGGNFVMPMINSYFLLRQLEDIDQLLKMRDNVCNLYEDNGLHVKRFHQAPSIYEYETSKAKKIINKAEHFKVQILYENYIIHSNLYSNHRNITPNSEHIQKNTVMLPNSLTLNKDSIKLIYGAIKMAESF